MEILEQRREYIKQAVMLARDSYNITTGFSVGAQALEPTDIKLLFVPGEGADPVAVYKKLNYLISSDMKPQSGETLSRDPECIAKKYTLADGFVLTVYISGARTAESMDWWRPLFDSARLVEEMDQTNRVQDDKLKEAEEEDDLPELAPEEPEAEEEVSRFKRHDHVEPETAAAPVAAPEPEPVPEPAPEPEPERSSEQEELDENEEYWNFVSAQMRNARHAIAAESFIRANEILNVLRKMLIELICVRNGIESDFDAAIDYIECEEKDMLIKTYPTGMNKAGFITALSTVTTLFDRLA